MVVKTAYDKLEIIKTVSSLWEPLTVDQRTLLLKHINIERFKKNEIIYAENETPKSLMCLFNGKVKICKDGVSGRNQIIQVLKPVEMFGYRAFFANEDYKTAAVAFEASVIAFIPMEIITRLISENRKIGFFFIHDLSVGLGQANDRTVNLTQKHIRGRLAEALLFLKDSYGIEEDGHTLSIYLSREDLANLSNMTTSNAIRTLSTFASERLIATDGRKIKIIQEEELRKVSKLG